MQWMMRTVMNQKLIATKTEMKAMMTVMVKMMLWLVVSDQGFPDSDCQKTRRHLTDSKSTWCQSLRLTTDEEMMMMTMMMMTGTNRTWIPASTSSVPLPVASETNENWVSEAV
jgi:hypothetical protein